MPSKGGLRPTEAAGSQAPVLRRPPRRRPLHGRKRYPPPAARRPEPGSKIGREPGQARRSESPGDSESCARPRDQRGTREQPEGRSARRTSIWDMRDLLHAARGEEVAPKRTFVVAGLTAARRIRSRGHRVLVHPQRLRYPRGPRRESPVHVATVAAAATTRAPCCGSQIRHAMQTSRLC